MVLKYEILLYDGGYRAAGKNEIFNVSLVFNNLIEKKDTDAFFNLIFLIVSALKNKCQIALSSYQMENFLTLLFKSKHFATILQISKTFSSFFADQFYFCNFRLWGDTIY